MFRNISPPFLFTGKVKLNFACSKRLDVLYSMSLNFRVKQFLRLQLPETPIHDRHFTTTHLYVIITLISRADSTIPLAHNPVPVPIYISGMSPTLSNPIVCSLKRSPEPIRDLSHKIIRNDVALCNTVRMELHTKMW